MIRLTYRAKNNGHVVHKFTEVIGLPASLDNAPGHVLEPIVRLLTLAASLSYFKAFAPAALEVPSGVTDRERHFVTELMRHGLGEFAYVNDIPSVLQPEVVAPSLSDTDAQAQDVVRPEPRNALAAVGGGKDSIVSIEALRGAGVDFDLFSVNSYAPIERTAEVAGARLLTAQRQLDPHLFALNEAGAPNGHVPITAVNSLVALLCALASGHDTVIFSNEASSSAGNVVWNGQTINHQWSKSSEFEGLLRQALPCGAPNYVSLLRPLTELRIARRFAAHTNYHGAFTSCNRAFRLDHQERTSWCADCPKCRFVFLCLAPFISRDALLTIFNGRDMFADKSQFEGFVEILGLDGLTKPFECVGEPDECKVAIDLLRAHQDWQDHPFLANPVIAGIVVSESQVAEVFAFNDGEHFLSNGLEAVAREV